MKILPAILLALLAGPASAQAPEATPAAAEATPETTPAPRAVEHRSRLQGAAYLGRHRDVVGAAVLVRPEGDPSRIYLTSTDAKGHFQVDGLPNGGYTVELLREGLAPVVKHGVELNFPFRAVVEVPMEPEAQPPAGAPEAPAQASEDGRVDLTGRVVERGGGPLSEVVLRLVRPGGRFDPRRLRTGADGAFDFPELPAGPWRLEADGVGLLPLAVDVDVAADTEIELSLVRQPADYEPTPLELMPPERLIPPPTSPTAPGEPRSSPGASAP